MPKHLNFDFLCDIIFKHAKSPCIWTGIEVVITGLTRNQLYLTVPWVRIPPCPPKKGKAPVWVLFLFFWAECARKRTNRLRSKPGFAYAHRAYLRREEQLAQFQPKRNENCKFPPSSISHPVRQNKRSTIAVLFYAFFILPIDKSVKLKYN